MELPSLASARSRGRLVLTRVRPLVARVRRLATHLRSQAPTLRGQGVGAAMMMTPAVAHALPLAGGGRTAVLIIAVLVGSAGALIVFGGLLLRAVLEPARMKGATSAQPNIRLVDTTPTVDDALRAFPHPRTAWTGLVLLAVTLSAGALWCLTLLASGRGADTLAESLLLGLPAVALGWAAWRSRVMWSGVPV